MAKKCSLEPDLILYFKRNVSFISEDNLIGIHNIVPVQVQGYYFICFMIKYFPNNLIILIVVQFLSQPQTLKDKILLSVFDQLFI
jgi:hypothetical protein